MIFQSQVGDLAQEDLGDKTGRTSLGLLGFANKTTNQMCLKFFLLKYMSLSSRLALLGLTGLFFPIHLPFGVVLLRLNVIVGGFLLEGLPRFQIQA